MIDYDQIEPELNLYERGRMLRTTINTPGWETVLETIHSYVEDIDRQMRAIPVGDPSVVPSHAALFALDKFETYFKQDISNAIEVSENPSEDLQHYLIESKDRFDVRKAMDTAS
jgi:hypothetical protein